MTDRLRWLVKDVALPCGEAVASQAYEGHPLRQLAELGGGERLARRPLTGGAA